MGKQNLHAWYFPDFFPALGTLHVFSALSTGYQFYSVLLGLRQELQEWRQPEATCLSQIMTLGNNMNTNVI